MNKCNQADKCNSTVCTHRKPHKKDAFCDGNCRWGDSECKSELEEKIKDILDNVEAGYLSANDSFADIMAAINEEYGE